jgi:hypothetical protein
MGPRVNPRVDIGSAVIAMKLIITFGLMALAPIIYVGIGGVGPVYPKYSRMKDANPF